MEEKRQKVFAELLTTEKQYIADMKMYVKLLWNPWIMKLSRTYEDGGY